MFMNKKGFSLIELLIAITIIGIILSITITTLTKVTQNNKEQIYDVNKDALVNAAKIYNDIYYIDSFGDKKNGCSKVSYSTLVEKDLIKNYNHNINCGYKIDKNDITESEDSSGVIIRKVNNRYYYETVLYCNDGKKEKSQANDYISGPHMYYNTIDNTYCNEEATEDNEPPIIYYRNNNFRYYYNSSNLPNPQISIVDSNTGLNNKESYNYIWSQGSSFVGNYKTFNVNKGAGIIAWHDVTLPEDILNLNTNQTYKLSITERNISDLAGNTIKPSNRANYIQVIQPTTFNPEKSNGNNEISLEDTFHIENDLPIISYTLQSNGSTIESDTWTNHDVVATISMSDSSSDNIVSGIYKIEEKIENGDWTTTWHAKDHGGVTGTERLGTITKTYTYTTEQSKKYYFRVTDWAGNVKEESYTIKIDNQPPSAPVVNLYLKNNRTNLNGSSDVSGLSSYSNDTWTRSYVFTKASGSTDRGNGDVYYLVTTSGAVGKKDDEKQSYKNINNEGTSSVSYKACDSLGNCTLPISKTVKLDRTAPGVDTVLEGTSGQTTGTNTNRWNAVRYKCTDALSLCTSNTEYTHVNLTKDLTVTFYDNAGNSATLTPVEYANLYLVHIVGDSDNPPNYATREKAIRSAKTEQVSFIKSNSSTKINTGKVFKMQFFVDGKRFIGSPSGEGYNSNPITGGYWTNSTSGCGASGERYPSWGSIKPSYIRDKTMYSCYYCGSCSSNKILCSNGKSCNNSY